MLTPTAVLLLVTVLMTPRATRHGTFATALWRRFLRELVVTSHVTRLSSARCFAWSVDHSRRSRGLLVLQRRSHLLRTLRMGSLDSCHQFSLRGLKTESKCTNNNNDNDKRSEKCFCYCLWDVGLKLTKSMFRIIH